MLKPETRSSLSQSLAGVLFLSPSTSSATDRGSLNQPRGVENGVENELEIDRLAYTHSGKAFKSPTFPTNLYHFFTTCCIVGHFSLRAGRVTDGIQQAAALFDTNTLHPVDHGSQTKYLASPTPSPTPSHCSSEFKSSLESCLNGWEN
jgi:hypothetical protein